MNKKTNMKKLWEELRSLSLHGDGAHILVSDDTVVHVEKLQRAYEYLVEYELAGMRYEQSKMLKQAGLKSLLSARSSDG